MLRHRMQPLRTLCRLSWPLMALFATVLTAGCAQLPDLGVSPVIQGPEALQADASLKAPSALWPQVQWWSAYGDAQLNALMEEALAESPNLAAAVARMERAEAVTQQAGSTRKPQVSANAAVSEEKLSYNHITPRAMTPDGINDYGRITLDLRWELDLWGKSRAGLAAATSELEAGRAELAQARLLLASSLGMNYAELSHLYANRDVAERAVAVRTKTAELFAQRSRNGMETRGSVRAADAGRATAEGALLTVDEQIALQRNRLAALLGAGPDRGLKIARPTLKLDHSFGLPPQLWVDLLGRRPDVVAARQMVQAQASRIDQKKAEFYPNVNLSAFIGVQALGLDLLTDSGSRVGGIGPAISLPLFTGGRLQGELRGTQAGYAERVANYNATVSRALQEVADNAVSQRALEQRLNKAQEAVDASTEAHRIARNRYEGGLATYLEVLAAEDHLLDSLSARTHLRALSLTLDIGLQRALGGGYQVAQR